MANILSNLGIVNGQQITVNEITQIIDVFNGTTPSDVTLSGELFPTGSTTRIVASNGFIGSLYGTASVSISSSISSTGPLTYNSASYALTSSVLSPLKTNAYPGPDVNISAIYTTGIISGYGQINNSNSTTITGLTELIGKSMDTTGHSGSVFVAMYQNNNGDQFNVNNVIIPYQLSGSNLTFQTLNGNSVAGLVTFNYIITYI
jgi:hypothetical protein